MNHNFGVPSVNLALSLLIATMFGISCTKNVKVTSVYNSVSPSEGAGNAAVTLKGSGLSDIRSVVFDLGDVPVALNTNFNTNNAIIFRVPAGANVGPQHIVFTNAAGYQFSVPFTVLAVPTLVSAFPVDWQAGNKVTITGNYLATANHVSLSGSADTATIISATATQLVIQLPASLVPTAKLTVTNDAGSSTTSFSLVNMDQQRILFADAFGPGMQDWSWSATHTASTNYAASGTTSLESIFGSGGGQGVSFHSDDTMVLSQYQYISMYVKGGSVDNTITVASDGVIAGAGAASQAISIPANVWTYVQVPMTTYAATTSCQRFNIQITGPAGGDQTLYFDNVILVKQ